MLTFARRRSIETHNLLSKLRELDRSLGQSEHPEYLETVLHQLEHVVSCPRCQQAYNEGDSELDRLISSIQSRACRCFSILERSEALKARRKGSFGRYVENVSRALLREAEYLELNSSSRVLFIGCGAMPVSCHVLARQFGCHVVGLDIDPENVQLASKFQAECSDVSRLAFQVGDGCVCRTDGFTHVFVASLVEEKRRILEHLVRNVQPETTVALRFGDGLRRIINYELPNQTWEGWGRVGLISLPQSLYQTLVLSRGR